jgi:predicted RNA-binding protein YlqC (UPF0109 family)
LSYFVNTEQYNTTATLTALVAGLCRHPKTLSIEVVPGRKTVLTIRPHRADYGAIYGQGGRTLASIRCVTEWIFERRDAVEAIVLLEQSGIGELEPRLPFAGTKDWPPKLVERLALETCAAMFDGNLSHEWKRAAATTSKLTIMTEDTPTKRLEAALGKVLDTIGAAHGQRIILELISTK